MSRNAVADHLIPKQELGNQDDPPISWPDTTDYAPD